MFPDAVHHANFPSVELAPGAHACIRNSTCLLVPPGLDEDTVTRATPTRGDRRPPALAPGARYEQRTSYKFF